MSCRNLLTDSNPSWLEIEENKKCLMTLAFFFMHFVFDKLHVVSRLVITSNFVTCNLVTCNCMQTNYKLVSNRTII